VRAINFTRPARLCFSLIAQGYAAHPFVGDVDPDALGKLL